MRHWLKTRPTAAEPFIVVDKTRSHRIPDEVLCPNCWISENTAGDRASTSKERFRWKEQEPQCPGCSNTLVTPIPFSEVW